MSRATFDPSHFKLEDLFRAKDEQRQRLAKLPFEEKIKIVEKLRASVSTAMRNERLVFESFLKVCPNFAGEPIKEWDVVEDWYPKRALEPPPHPFDKRPDIIARTTSERKIGVELKSWVNQEQITEARKQERIRENILKAIGKQPPNETQHIGQVWLSPKQVRFDARDASDFKTQVFELIGKVEQSWSERPGKGQKSWQDISDFDGFPFLERYLDRARFHSVKRRLNNNWILFPDLYPNGHYSPNTMRETLGRALRAHKNADRYKDLKQRVGLDEVYLLVHYDFKAFLYNTPFKAPGFGFKEAANLASSQLGGEGGHFDRIFLFHFLWGKEKGRRIL